ncbi:DUF998 domain-containing protein [Streptomyces sp. NPDC057743]|uniref:DUF998 domain-containing protein n=1 Tax=Streptomyces sp. NPDC057743 TaxID=3346236 RepID=UPI0036B8E0A5
MSVRPTRPAPGARTAAAAVLFLGALAYTAWVWELVIATGLDPVRAYVSELAAADQPLGGLFRATDLVAGLLVLLGALLALATTRRRPWTSAGLGALALFGAATALDSRLPLSCPPTSDPVCAARETAGLVPATHTAHAVSSTLAMLGALAALILLTVAARRYGQWPALARLGPALVLAELAATAWTMAEIAVLTAGRDTWALGVGQRLQVLLVAVYLAVLAGCLARPGPRAEPDPEPVPTPRPADPPQGDPAP